MSYRIMLMLITSGECNHFIIMTDSEAECLLDACALVILAGQSNQHATLTPQMSALLCSLFEGLSKGLSNDSAQRPLSSFMKPAKSD